MREIADLGCDFLSTGTHKWLFGPTVQRTVDQATRLKGGWPAAVSGLV